MKGRRKKGYIFLFSFFVLLLVVIIHKTYRQKQQIPPQKSGLFNYKRERDELMTTFSSMPSREFYEWFKKRYQRESPAVQNLVHILAHDVGVALFYREDYQGALICDDAFQFGCYHGFMGEALTKGGKNAMKNIESSCEKTSLYLSPNCFHGLGHGILLTTGYTVPDLLKGLARCDSLKKDLSRQGCYSGIFMEYNRRVGFFSYPGGLGLREFDEQHSLSPCEGLAKKYLYSCYAELPWWWKSSLKKPPVEQIKAMVELCGKIEANANRDVCFYNIGFIIALESNKIDEVISHCNFIAISSDRFNCIVGSKNSLLYRKVPNAKILCDVFEQDDDPKLKKDCLVNQPNYQ